VPHTYILGRRHEKVLSALTRTNIAVPKVFWGSKKKKGMKKIGKYMS
jgi:hypothetical protein